METPYLPSSLFGEDFRRVYEPAEDTFILLDALEKDLNILRKNTYVCLEIGSGSGTVITALAKALCSPKLLLATDINPEACKTTKKCARYHNKPDIQVIRTNLAESLVDRLEGQVDVIIFNPPYVPTDANEDLTTAREIQLSWAGGQSGRQLIDKFLGRLVPRLMSKPNGVTYLVAIEQNGVQELVNLLKKDRNIEGSVVMQRKAGIEDLYVIRYSWT